jgi:CBS domain-containing protein
MENLSIGQIMTRQPATVAPDDQVDAAQTLLARGDIHHLPVVEGKRLVGIVSSADLLKLHLLDGGIETAADLGLTVRKVMQPAPVVVTEDASLQDAATRFSLGGYHALPVVDADDQLIGIVTTTDLITRLLEQAPQ